MRLGTKFVLLATTILVVTLGLTAVYLGEHQRRLNREGLLADSRSQGALLAMIAPDAIVGYNFTLLDDYVAQVVRHPDVVFAAVFDPLDRPLTTFMDNGNPLIDEVRGDGTATVTEVYAALSGRDNILMENIPIDKDGKSLGRLVVAMDTRRIDSELASLLHRQMVAYGIIIVALSFALYAVFRLKVLRPIGALMWGARRVAEGNYRQEVKRYADDELGTLTNAFNAMMKEIGEEREQLAHHAYYDTLTGLPNRKMAMERIECEINRTSRGGGGFAVFFLDMDDFKLVNDTMGHAVGDKLLVNVGRRLDEQMRSIDLLARLGGDEFLMVVSSCDSRAVAEGAAHRLVDAFKRPLIVDGEQVHTKFSVGIALYPEDGHTADALLAAADSAMYASKFDPISTVRFFTKAMNDEARQRIEYEQDIYRAIEYNEFSLEFQPVVGLSDMEHLGAEALLRWHHPTKGLIPPADFIPVAEQTGQIKAIGDWVLDTACRSLKHLEAEGLDAGLVSINVARAQLHQGFGERAMETLKDLGIPADRLMLEIGEGALLDASTETTETLERLRSAGVRLALDGFGTGLSSLCTLRRFSFDVVKIDRAFVAGLPDNQDSCSLAGAIIAMARSLGPEAVATGVENEAQRACLLKMGCRYFQGHLGQPPLVLENYRHYLSRVHHRLPATDRKHGMAPAIGSVMPPGFEVDYP